jgi:hypothetical protein
VGQLLLDFGGGWVVRAHLQNLLKVLAGKLPLIGFLIGPSQVIMNLVVVEHLVRFRQLKLKPSKFPSGFLLGMSLTMRSWFRQRVWTAVLADFVR